ncbi:MAG: ABC transporter substrate-binding protein [Alphaproteobacteria bacterium]|jgi:ABC-type Fe3+-hydroxamate transport system substrate-binding protein|nr:ABC transporter substrate-binding protein [Alphaproteobacteria bacterium]
MPAEASGQPFSAQEPCDAIGTAHPPVEESPRIASLVPSLTELMFALGLGRHVVARTRFCTHPPEAAETATSVGGTKKIKMARLLDLKPTHVLVNIDETPKPLADELAAAGIRVVVTHPIAPRDNLSLYALFGHIFQRPAEAAALSRRFEEAYDRLLAADWPPARVLYLIWPDPWMTVSRETYIARMLALVGWQTVPAAAAARYPALEADDPAFQDADRILFSTEPYPFSEESIAAFREARPDIGADLRLIDGEMLSWYGSRAIAALDYLGRYAAALRT